MAIAPVYAPEQPVGWQPTALIWPLASPLYPDDALLAAFRQPTALTWPLPPRLPEQPVGWQPTALIWPLAPPLYPDDALLAAFRLATYSPDLAIAPVYA